MMFGIHFYSHVTLKRSFCGFVSTVFTGDAVTNADHNEFLSTIQASSTLWAPCFSHVHFEAMKGDEPGELNALTSEQFLANQMQRFVPDLSRLSRDPVRTT